MGLKCNACFSTFLELIFRSYLGATGRAVFSAPTVDDPVNDVFVTLDTVKPPDCPDLNVIFSDRWIETQSDVFIQYGPQGGPGDVYIFDNNEVATPGGLVGLVSGECTVLPGPNADTFCTISFEFPEGTITIQGPFFRSMSITGATGCFTGITGLVEGADVSSDFSVEDFLSYLFTVDGIDDEDLGCRSDIFDYPWFETGEDQYIDYDRDNMVSPGDMFVFDYHRVFVSAIGANALAAGRCIVIEEAQTNNNSFCSILFAFPNGELVIQGFFDELTIIGGSGCFTGTQGKVQVSTSGNFFEYTFFIDE